MTSHVIDSKDHWDAIYKSKALAEVSWFQGSPTYSLEMIKRVAPTPTAHILDVGSGASTLIGALLGEGYRHVTATDISSVALAKSRQQLGPNADQVNWLAADVRFLVLPPNSVDVWHDRAVFHFLTRTSDR